MGFGAEVRFPEKFANGLTVKTWGEFDWSGWLWDRNGSYRPTSDLRAVDLVSEKQPIMSDLLLKGIRKPTIDKLHLSIAKCDSDCSRIKSGRLRPRTPSATLYRNLLDRSEELMALLAPSHKEM